MAKKLAIKTVSEKADLIRSKYFPFKISSKITCHISTRDEVLAAANKNYDAVFKDTFEPKVKIKKYSPEWKGLESTSAEYRKIHSEYFIFKLDGKIVGWFMGQLEDFETFYMRNTGIIPKHQNKGIYKAFLPHCLKYLKELGYQRVSSQHSPDNGRMFALKMNHGFIIVGSENHDRWGTLVKMVRFLDENRSKAYLKTF